MRLIDRAAAGVVSDVANLAPFGERPPADGSDCGGREHGERSEHDAQQARADEGRFVEAELATRTLDCVERDEPDEPHDRREEESLGVSREAAAALVEM